MEVGPNLTLGTTGKQPDNTELQSKSISSKRLNVINIRHSFKPDDIVLTSSTRGDNLTEASGPPSPREGDIRNFGEVCQGLYRSSFPGSCNLEHLESLHLKTLVTLVTTPFEPQLEWWLKNVNHYCVKIPAHKTSEDTIPLMATAQVMKLLMDETKHPILIHCNKGKHRTGCMVASFRKLQGMDDVGAITEYHKYAGAKARAFDVAFISRIRREEVMKAVSELELTVPICHKQDHASPDESSEKETFIKEKNIHPSSHQQVDTSRTMVAPESPLSPILSVKASGPSVGELVDALSKLEDLRNKDTLTPPITPDSKTSTSRDTS